MNDSTITPPDTIAPGSPVSWQTIFWTIISLAITTMSQPGGRVCGLPSRYRTYLRCSPLLCAADALSGITRLLVSTTYLRQSPLEAVGMLLHSRFKGPDHADEQASSSQHRQALLAELEEAEAEGIQSLEKMTWLRWTWFILGTLPAAIKLASMRGIPWAQAWGMMFLSSWLINESLIIFATFNQSFFTVSDSGRISWPGFEQTTQLMRYEHILRAMNLWDACLATGALIVHIVITNGVFRALWRRIEYGNSYPLSAPITMPGPSYTSIISVGMAMGFSFLALLPRNLRSSILKISFYTLPLAAFYLMILNVGLNTASYGLYDFSISGSAGYVFVISTAAVLTAMALIRSLSQRFLMLGRNLLVLYPQGAEGNLTVDLGTCLALVFFLTTLLACFLWYCYIYDPSGTFNPTWTGVFG